MCLRIAGVFSTVVFVEHGEVCARRVITTVNDQFLSGKPHFYAIFQSFFAMRLYHIRLLLFSSLRRPHGGSRVLFERNTLRYENDSDAAAPCLICLL